MDLVIKLVLASFATYRLAQLITLDSGPFFIFRRIRVYAARKNLQETEREDKRKEADPNYKTNRYGFWSGTAKGITCPFCMGVWAAFLCAILIMFPSLIGDLFLVGFGLAGIQSVIERFTV